MCGRYTLSHSAKEIAEAMAIQHVLFTPTPNFNIAPTTKIPVIKLDEAGERTLEAFRWGLIPAWYKDVKQGPTPFNARAEGLATSGMFRSALKQRRCLIAGDGFYEWKKEGKAKQPMFIRFKDERVFAFAGLWEEWKHDGETTRTCTIITTTPNELMEPIHNRMPVILTPDGINDWLASDLEQDELLHLLKPYEGDDMEAYPVHADVGSVSNNNANNTKRLEIEEVEHTKPINSK